MMIHSSNIRVCSIITNRIIMSIITNVVIIRNEKKKDKKNYIVITGASRPRGSPKLLP